MMWWTSSFLLFLGTFTAVSYARPMELQDIFNGFVKNVNLYSPEKQSQIVKRRVYEENSDAGIKQVSLQSLIGDLEQNFYQSASNAASLVQSQAAAKTDEHTIVKRKTDDVPAKETVETEAKKEVEVGTSTAKNDVVVEPSEKIPTKDGGPTHILVDRISVQPHYGDLPIIPAFTLQHTKLISATIKDAGSNTPQITITKANVQTVPVQVAPAERDNHEKNGESANTSTTTQKATNENEQHSTATSTTTQKSVAELKEAEAELKEKVAEIEAEPVILSARV